MGLIEKSIRKRSNQKLAAEVLTPTALSFDEVVEALRKYCDAQNADVTRLVEVNQAKAKTRMGKWTANLQDPRNSHYYLSPHPEMRQVLIGFGQRPEPILAGRGNTHQGVWAARLSYPAGGSTVGLILLKWVIGGNDGVLKNRGFYESLLENVHAAISSEAQQARGSERGPASDAFPAAADQAPGEISVPPSPSAGPGSPNVPIDRPAAPEIAEVVQPQRARVGDWVADLRASFPFLERNDILGFAGMRALLAVDTGYYSSTYITEGTHSASQLYASSTHSLLRSNIIQHSGATLLTCGALNPDRTFVDDWQMKYVGSDNGEAVIDVPHHRMTNGGLRSGELMVQLREAVTATLASGIHLHLGEGPPSMDSLVASMAAGTAGYPDDDNSPFGHDHLGGLSDVHREPLALPVATRDAVLTAMTGSHFRSSPGSGDVLRLASLAGGRPFDAGSAIFRRAGETDQLTVNIPEALEPPERERSYRAALRFLFDIARQLKESEPDVAAAIDAHREHIDARTREAWVTASGTRLKNRPSGVWIDYWNRATVAPMVPIAAGRWYPIGVLVTTPMKANYVTRAAQAADWVTALKRTQPILNPNGRPSGRHGFSARRCGLLHNSNGQALPYLRYAWTDLTSDQGMTAISPAPAWFWEVSARALPASEPSGSNGGLLLVNGWSHADGVLSYGENLLSMLRSFAEVVSATDDHARIRTLYLAT